MKFKKETTRFTSDLHLHHKNIMKYNSETRDGVDADDMVKIMIKNWNDSVSDTDDVWILGDVSFGSEIKTVDALQQMNGKKWLVLGNHDHKITTSPDLMGCFQQVFESYKEIHVDDRKIVMCHYPIESWNQIHRGAIHLHGHVHGRYGDNNAYNRMDVGVDSRKDKLMIPFTFDEVLVNLGTRKENLDLEFREGLNR